MDSARVQGLRGTLGLVLPVTYFHSLMTSSSIFCRVLQTPLIGLQQQQQQQIRLVFEEGCRGLPVFVVRRLVLWAICEATRNLLHTADIQEVCVSIGWGVTACQQSGLSFTCELESKALREAGQVIQEAAGRADKHKLDAYPAKLQDKILLRLLRHPDSVVN